MPTENETQETNTDQVNDSQPDTGNESNDLAAEVEKWKSLARKQEERAKANAKAAKELEDFKRQHMTDQEKAIEEAKALGRAEALSSLGTRLVDAEIRAVAAGRLSPEQLDVLFQGLNRSVFMTDDGSVDIESIKKFIDGIAPKQENAVPTFGDAGQGVRGQGTPALNSDFLLRDLKKRLGIS